MACLYILGDLGGAVTTASYTITFFGLGNGLAVPLGLTYGGRFGKKVMAITCLYAFLIVTAGLGFVPNYPIFILFRFLQGFFSGPLLILIPSMLTTLATQQERRKFTRTISVVFITVSTLSAALGGTLAYELNWRWIFLFDGAIPLITSYFFIKQLKDQEFPIHNQSFDLLGYLAYFLSITSLAVFVILMQQLDYFTSNLMIAMVVIFALTFPAFIIQSKHHPHPILKFSLLKNPQMITALIQLTILFATYYSMMFLLSVWLHIYANYTPNWITAILLTMLISTLLILGFVQKLHTRNSPYILLIGLLAFLLGSWMTMLYNPEVNLGRLITSRLIMGIGLALFLPPLLFMIVSCCQKEEGIEGLAFFHVFRTLGCCFGLGLLETVWQRRQIFYHQRLGSQLTQFSQLVDQFHQTTNRYFLSPNMSRAGLSRALSEQSASLGLNDTFYLITLLIVGLILLLIGFLVYKSRSSPPSIDLKHIISE